MKQHYLENETTSSPLGHSIASAARCLSVGRTKVYHLLRQGLLRGVKIGDRTIIPDHEIRSLLARAPSYQPKGE